MKIEIRVAIVKKISPRIVLWQVSCVCVLALYATQLHLVIDHK